MVVGEPGVGKSRLIYEFLRRLDGQGVVELEGTGVSYGQAIPYRPILELVRRYLALKEGMPGEEIRQRVVYRLRALGLEGDEPAALLAHFLGVPAPPPILNRLSGAQLKERTFGALRDLFFRASQDAPLVLVVENIHWLDPSSEEFVQYCRAGLPGHRVLLVLSGRPGFGAAVARRPRGGHGSRCRVWTTARSERMTRSLIQANTLAAPLAKILDDKSEGNPLYVEEILRELQETAGIVVENGEARLRRATSRCPPRSTTSSRRASTGSPIHSSGPCRGPRSSADDPESPCSRGSSRSPGTRRSSGSASSTASTSSSRRCAIPSRCTASGTR